jgi:hypothetical protein
MKVCFVQSGGFVGAVKRWEVNTSSLEHSEAEQLERMVRDSGLSRSSSELSAHARDLKQYEITIEGDGKAICVAFDDQNVPASAHALLKFLQQRARPGKL